MRIGGKSSKHHVLKCSEGTGVIIFMKLSVLAKITIFLTKNYV